MSVNANDQRVESRNVRSGIRSCIRASLGKSPNALSFDAQGTADSFYIACTCITVSTNNREQP